MVFTNKVSRCHSRWITAGHSSDTFKKAGELGANLLFGLIEHNIDQFIEKLAVYRDALTNNVFDPSTRQVTLMLHTFLAKDYQLAKAIVREPLKKYLNAFVHISMNELEKNGQTKRQLANLSNEDVDTFYEQAVDRYLNNNSLIGTPESCQNLVSRLHQEGVTEIACLMDFGLPQESIEQGLTYLSELNLKNKKHA